MGVGGEVQGWAGDDDSPAKARQGPATASAGAGRATALALAPERAHAREELVALLWPGVAPDVGRNRLRQVLSTLKSLLEPAGAPGATVLQADRQCVRVVPGALASAVADGAPDDAVHVALALALRAVFSELGGTPGTPVGGSALPSGYTFVTFVSATQIDIGFTDLDANRPDPFGADDAKTQRAREGPLFGWLALSAP